MVTEVFSICDAYESGYGDGLQERNHSNPWYVNSKEAEAWAIGYHRGAQKAAKSTANHYYFISYRVIQASGGIFYHYAVTDLKPRDWVIGKLEACEYKDHYSISHVEDVDNVFYETYRGYFKEGKEKL